MTASGPLLEYGLGEPTTRRRRRRLVYTLAVLALIAGAALLLRPRWQAALERWARLREVARGVASLEEDNPAAGTVALEEDPTRAAALWDRDEYMRIRLGRFDQSDQAARRPKAWYRLHTAGRTPAAVPLTSASPVLFSHRLRTPDGLSRLVVVECGAQWLGDTDRPTTRLEMVATTVATDGPPHFPLRAMTAWRGPTLEGARGAGGFGVRVFAGRADPADPSHFTIEFETGDGHKGMVDGWLRNAAPYGEHVEMRVRP